ncbi:MULTISPECIES: BON domain-containing protein [Legionella]|nr:MULTISPECIES: BON domain-containing protein [Legionella]MCP0914876.1 BON domain-containing protein [Legionella sp. 27cVA30]
MLLACGIFSLTGCLNALWTSANLFYDRHDVYKQAWDMRLAAEASHALYFKDKKFKCSSCYIDLAVFNRDILLAGHVPSARLREEAQQRLARLHGYRRLFNQLGISPRQKETLADAWLTAKIRSRILADPAIDPDQFKIVTVDQIVYLMGDVIPAQARRVIKISRECSGVKRVVKLLKYYNLSDQALT